MGNRTSLLSLIENKSAFVSHAQQRIVESTLSFFPDSGSFTENNNTKEMFKALSKAFSVSNVIIIGVDCSLWLSFKKLLLQALNLAGETDSEIADLLSAGGEDVAESIALSHALKPKGAVTFFSEDGLFSGFATKSGNQHLIAIPLDPKRIDSVIDNGFYAYLQSIAGTVMPAAESVVAEQPAQTAKRLLASGLSVAIASTKTSLMMKHAFGDAGDFDSTFLFVNCLEEKGGLSQKEFVADLARQARENSPCALGAAISSVFSSEKEDGRLFVFVAVADGVRARVAKVFGEPGETPRMLVEAAADTLLDMLTDYAQAGGFTGYPAKEDDTAVPLEEKKQKNNLALKLIIAFFAALLLCLAVVFFAGKASAFIKNRSNDITGTGAITTSLQT